MHNKFDHMQVKGAVSVQQMVRSDLASSGVAFTLDPDTGFRNAIVITGSYGLGESVVGGRVDPDEVQVRSHLGAVDANYYASQYSMFGRASYFRYSSR